MIRVTLPEVEVKELEELLQTTDDADLRHRVQIVLMAYRGRRHDDHLLKTRGIRVGKSALLAFGAKHGIHPNRPTERLLRGDPTKQAEAREEIADLKKGRPSANSSS